MAGTVVSRTVTLWLQLALLPQWSAAVQVRVTVNNCGHEPGAVTSANVTTGFGSHASCTSGAGKTGVFGHSIGEIVAGHVIAGGVVSTTVIVWLHDAWLPQWSVEVHVRVTL